VNLGEAIQASLKKATKDFTRAKMQAHGQRETRVSQRTIDRWNKQDADRELKAAAYKVIPQCYMKVSDNGNLPANKRQIYYAVRPLVLEATGKTWKNSETFTQDVLPAYCRDYPDLTRGWDIVADARGHFAEPHVRRRIGIGTLEVRSYLDSFGEPDMGIGINDTVPTTGPANRYKFALFIEKEGFDSLLERSGIAERYDLAIFSSKGQTNVATRKLADELSAEGVTILVLHDFDAAGFSITHWLSNDNDKYTFKNDPKVIDLGLRLADVEAMGLQSEEQVHKQRKDPTEKFWDWDEDITRGECDFLRGGYSYEYGWEGQRVELNAMTSRQFVEYLEDKFRKAGVTKVIPSDSDFLARAWKRSLAIAKAREAIDEIEWGESPAAPKGLEAKIRRQLKRDSKLSWDAALARIAREHLVKEEEK
jgi:hypothetical protein